MSSESLRKTVRGFFNVGEGRARYKEIRKRILAGAKVDGIHVMQLIAAMLIASIGLNLNSTEAIIGAMLICPLMGSVLAIAYALTTADSKVLRESTIGLTVQVLVCLATSTLYFVTSPITNVTSALDANTNATFWDVAIAFVGGFAGALGTSRKQEPSTLLAGVAVATSLMPPLCATGYGIATRDFLISAQGFYEFLINVVFIAFGAYIVLVLLRVPILADLDGDGIVSPDEERIVIERSRSMRIRLVVGSLLLALPCLFFTSQLIHKSMVNNGVIFELNDTYDTKIITEELDISYPEVTGYRIGEQDTYNTTRDALERDIVATVLSKKELDEPTRSRIEKLIRLHVENVSRVAFEVEN